MKFATVTPRNLLTPLSEHLGGYHLILAQEVLKHGSYAKYYQGRRELGDYVILDHGIAEGIRLSEQELKAAYLQVHPNEIIVPDILNSREHTFDQAYYFLRRPWVRDARLAGTKVMVVPQGGDWEDWKLSFAELLSLKPDVIGISKFDASFIPEVGVHGRTAAVQFIRTYIQDHRLMPQIHLLGLYQNPIELAIVQENVGIWVRGCDSTMPIAAAFHNDTFHPMFGALMRHPAWEYDSDLLLTAGQAQRAITNIQLCQAWAAVGCRGFEDAKL